MNYQQFKKEWKRVMAYKPEEFDVEQDLNDYYTLYKDDPMYRKMTVEKWCIFFFADLNLETHSCMLKSKMRKKPIRQRRLKPIDKEGVLKLRRLNLRESVTLTKETLKEMEEELRKFKQDITFREFVGYEACMNKFKEKYKNFLYGKR